MTSQYAIRSIHEIFRNRHCYNYSTSLLARGLEWEPGQTADTIFKGMTIASSALREMHVYEYGCSRETINVHVRERQAVGERKRPLKQEPKEPRRKPPKHRQRRLEWMKRCSGCCCYRCRYRSSYQEHRSRWRSAGQCR